MGNYNPHAPYIIGEEWVPIRSANYAPDKLTEQGYTFHIDHSVTPITGAYYVAEVPQTRVNLVSDLVSVYPAGQEALTGPIKQIFIPVSAVWVTGASIIGATVAKVLNPSDGQSITFDGPSDSNSFLGLSFDVTSYSQQLMGKRILDVSIRYSISVNDIANIQQIGSYVGYAKDWGNKSISLETQTLQASFLSEPTQVNSFSLSSLNYWWDSTRDIYTVLDLYPWRYQELARFAATEAAPTRMVLTFFNGITADDNGFLQFADMQVTYCEETRVLYGGRLTNNLDTVNASAYNVGPNIVRLFDRNFASNTTALTPGDYTVTLTHEDIPVDGLIGSPKVNALRELYQIGPQQGLRVNKSLIVDDEFAVETTPVITEITLHTSSAVVTGVHPYGIQDDVPVYGTITAIQEIEDDPVLTATAFPQVRFYARRFGATTVPLTLVDVASGLSTASITVEEFDALPEIVDGWREVNLRFTVPPSFSVAAGDIDWRWQATNELARNQWQVLGMGSRAFAAHSIGPASYYAPQGNTVTLTWQSPVISGAADDTLSDAVIIFSTDPPTVSGFAVAVQSQEVDVAEGCLTITPCVPSEIYYHHMTWTIPAGIACDDFSTDVVAGWGNTLTGQAWVISAPASQWNVADGVGTIQPNANSSDRFSTVVTNSTNNNVVGTVSISALPATGSLYTGFTPRYTDGNNHYIARAQIATTGLVTAVLQKRVAGVSTTVASLATTLAITPNVKYRIRTQAVGTVLAMKIWLASQDEPLAWTLTATDTSLTSGTSVGVHARNDSAVTTQIFSYDDFNAVPFQLLDGRYEIQRSDTVDTEWLTILDTTNLCITGFSDYEARVGLVSSYRIRLCNALDFCGPTWATASSTLTSPGVDIAGDGNSILIFTSNENPSANLAYVMEWEGDPIESFAFPEASDVQLTMMFGKDFFTAFHPLERGGVQFTRTLLVNAAAIAVPSLPNFTQLRDLAWDDLNYVCVRDELGNRWFANVRVPAGVVRMDRTIYLAQIEVTEVTSTPTPISEVP
jgi:hypothetical protein